MHAMGGAKRIPAKEAWNQMVRGLRQFSIYPKVLYLVWFSFMLLLALYSFIKEY